MTITFVKIFLALLHTYQQLVAAIQESTLLEWTAVIAGIASVWFSKKENVLVYPIGLINTIIYTWISFQYHLPGEATVNFYYTIMSLYGWYLWVKKTKQEEKYINIEFSNSKYWITQLVFFASIYIVLYFSLIYLKEQFFEGAIPWADAFASATAFTGMWLMTRKKVESWYWWIATNIASIPLYFVKGLPLTSLYYTILLVLAISGLFSWIKKAKNHA
jgi:nicotinamide mononucleotide transporter